MDSIPFGETHPGKSLASLLSLHGWTLHGDPSKGFYACQNAYWISRKLDDTPLRIHAPVNAMHTLCWLGEFKLAESKIKELEKLIGKHPDSGVRVLYQLSRCEFTLFKGDFKEAEEIIIPTKNEAERHGLTYLFPVTMVYELMLKPHLEQYREAEEVGARLMDFANSTGHPNNKGDALLYFGRSFYFEGGIFLNSPTNPKKEIGIQKIKKTLLAKRFR